LDYWPRGKLLGGSSSINAMVWVRGAAADFDDGAAEGNSGWSYRDCLPFFKAIEDNEAGEDAWRGQGGAMRVTGPLPGFSPGLSNCRPTSRGSILARAADPSIAPRIAPNALATSEDVEACLEGVKLLRRLAAQPALSEVVEAELAPGPDVGADAELIQDFRMRAGDGPSSRRHVPDGAERRTRRRRRPPQGLWRRGLARGRRVGFSHDRFQQHQRGGDDGRREDRLADPRRRAPTPLTTSLSI
jgi:choline dehydrogenase-like flavoprotein